MRKLVFIIAIAAGFVNNGFSQSNEKTNRYKVDPAKSKLTWVGKKVTGEHTGNVAVSNGSLIYNGKVIQGGTFEIDMNSITCTDLTDPEYNGKLIGHLKSDDFFSTANHPKAKFVIKKVKPASGNAFDVTGDLTIKGITHEVTFPATVETKGNQITSNQKLRLTEPNTILSMVQEVFLII